MICIIGEKHSFVSEETVSANSLNLELAWECERGKEDGGLGVKG